MKRLWIAFFVGGLIWGLQQRQASGITPTVTEGLIHQNNLTYEGFFKIPSGSCGNQDCSGDWGGLCLTYDSAGNGGQGSLFVCGKSFGLQMAEISIPSGISASHNNLGQAPTATMLQGFTDPTSGRIRDVAAPGDNSIYFGGVLPFQSNKLIVTGVDFFGVNQNQRSHAIVSKNLSSPAFLGGWYEVSGNGPAGGEACGPSASCQSNYVNGSMAPIPLNWQTALDGDTLTGQCCITVGPRTSDGPSYTSFWSTDLGTKSPVPGHRLVGYPDTHPTLGNWDGTVAGNPALYAGYNGGFNVVWPVGSRSVLSFQVIGTASNFCYGIPVGDNSDGVRDPLQPTYDFSMGADASTSADGRTVYLPNARLESATNPGTNVGWTGSTTYEYTYIWLDEQRTPVKSRNGGARLYKGVSKITGYGNNLQPGAYVTVADPFPANLTGQNYKVGELTCYDPMGQGSTSPTPVHFHGPTAYPYERYVLAYDANDLVRVRNGQANMWDVVPYDYWMFNLPMEYPAGVPFARRELGAAAYDPDHRKIYLVQKETDNASTSVITVFGVSAPGSVPSSPQLCYAAFLAVWTGGSLIRRRKKLASA